MRRLKNKIFKSNAANWLDSIPSKKRVKNNLIYFSILKAVKFVRKLNRMNAIRLLQCLGLLGFHLASGERKKTIRHLTMAFGNSKTRREIHLIARRVFLNLSIAVADAIRLPISVQRDLGRFVSASGFHHIQKNLSGGKGAIIMTGHFGNWELLGAFLVQNGVPLSVVGTEAYDSRLDKMIVETRRQAGYETLTRGKGTRKMISGLKKGAAIGILFDQDTKVEGVFVDFFGRPAHTAVGPVVIAQKYNIPIIPVFIRHTENFTYHVHCQAPLELVNSGDAQKDIVTNTQLCSDVYERLIRQYPDQWVWMHRRWKKQPPQ